MAMFDKSYFAQRLRQRWKQFACCSRADGLSAAGRSPHCAFNRALNFLEFTKG
jgi:hypothetical protein